MGGPHKRGDEWVGRTGWDLRIVWRDHAGRLCSSAWVPWPHLDEIVDALRIAVRARSGGLEFIRQDLNK
jgi:hypothetical protein